MKESQYKIRQSQHLNNIIERGNQFINTPNESHVRIHIFHSAKTELMKAEDIIVI